MVMSAILSNLSMLVLIIGCIFSVFSLHASANQIWKTYLTLRNSTKLHSIDVGNLGLTSKVALTHFPERHTVPIMRSPYSDAAQNPHHDAEKIAA